MEGYSYNYIMITFVYVRKNFEAKTAKVSCQQVSTRWRRNRHCDQNIFLKKKQFWLYHQFGYVTYQT